MQREREKETESESKLCMMIALSMALLRIKCHVLLEFLCAICFCRCCRQDKYTKLDIVLKFYQPPIDACISPIDACISSIDACI